MIRISIDYIPHGILHPEEIAVIDIINNLSHAKRPEMGNYDIEVNKGGKIIEEFKVSNHHRNHGLTPLLKMIFNKLKLKETK